MLPKWKQEKYILVLLFWVLSLYDVNEIKFNKVIYIYVYVHHEYIDNVYSNSEFQDSSNRSKSLKALNNYCS